MPFRIEAILAASDLSGKASTALRAAGALAALTEADLHVVHAVEAVDADGIAPDHELRAGREALRDQFGTALPPSVRAASIHVAPGAAHEVILRRAADMSVDLLVIGPHREERAEDEPLGTTADRLVRTSAVPCLVVHAPISLPLRRIVVPSDLSKAAEAALDIALIWGAALRLPAASGQKTRLDVVHAVSVSDPAGSGRGADIERALRDQISAAERLTGVAGVLEVGTAVTQDGSPADAILRFAREHRADLLVLGTHGQSAPSGNGMGSVSSAVARRADRPVLLVPPGYWEEWRRRNEELQGERVS